MKLNDIINIIEDIAPVNLKEGLALTYQDYLRKG